MAHQRLVRHALVTGGGSGIGAEVARTLATRGMNVTVLGRSIDKVRAVAAERPDVIQAVSADVVDPIQVGSAISEAQERFGKIHVLVNNAGQAESAPFAKMDASSWHRMLDVNLIGTMTCAQAVLPEMLTAGWGRIVNVASTAGQVGYAYAVAYCAAKHGVIGFTRALAIELARKGITVNAVCPGYTETDLTRQSIERIVAHTGRSPHQALAELVKSNPQGRLVSPGDVASAVAWLTEESSASITGQSVSVSGGEVM